MQRKSTDLSVALCAYVYPCRRLVCRTGEPDRRSLFEKLLGGLTKSCLSLFVDDFLCRRKSSLLLPVLPFTRTQQDGQRGSSHQGETSHWASSFTVCALRHMSQGVNAERPNCMPTAPMMSPGYPCYYLLGARWITQMSL